MERRELLRWLAATAGLAALEGVAAEDLLALGRELHRRRQAGSVLGPAARRAVTVAAERILPAGDTPGATDAGVTEFIDRMLADWFDPSERAAFLAGIPELDRRSQALRGRDFTESTEADQVAVLTALDDELTAMRRAGQTVEANRHWFGRLKFLTVWGYFTSEPAARRVLGTFPMPGRFDGCAPYQAPA